VIIGPGDDAGVYALDKDHYIVETVDIITPVVNDPFTFGAISATNSLSDIYAMGGKPLTALAIVGFSPCDYGTTLVKEILRGAMTVLQKSGTALMGGHSFEDTELKFGLAVTGIIQKDKVLRAQGAKPEDIIILTKPVGTGVLSTALKGGKITDKDMEQAVSRMLTLNDTASEAALKAGANSATDVTGFGLLGHAHNMVKGSSVDFELSCRNVPVFDRVRELIAQGIAPEGAYNNLKFLEGSIDSKDISEEEMLVLADPQTSGGLLITLPENSLSVFKETGVEFSVIGKVTQGAGNIKLKP
jgi:selenide,water dikinase